jgi:hypothetical protein
VTRAKKEEGRSPLYNLHWLGKVRVCLAKRSYTCEINDLAYSLIRSFPLKFLP